MNDRRSKTIARLGSPFYHSTMSEIPNEVLPGLFIGDFVDAGNYKVLHKLGIRTVINLSRIHNKHEEKMTCHYIEIQDHQYADIAQHFATTQTMIQEGLKKGGVMVYCQMGISRSATIVMAYLMTEKGMTYDEAYALLVSKRPIVKPNLGFVRQLKNFLPNSVGPHLAPPSTINDVVTGSR